MSKRRQRIVVLASTLALGSGFGACAAPVDGEHDYVGEQTALDYMDRSLSAETRLRLYASSRGFDGDSGVYDGTDLLVDGDIAFGPEHLAGLDGELELPAGVDIPYDGTDLVDKGYQGDVVSAGLRNLCLWVHSSGSRALDSSWLGAFYAAAVQLNSVGSTMQVKRVVHASSSSDCPNGTMVISIFAASLNNTSLAADAHPPIPFWGLVFPGSRIRINSNNALYPKWPGTKSQQHIALHELAHTFGVDHWNAPRSGSEWVPFTCYKTNSSCDSAMARSFDAYNVNTIWTEYGSDDHAVLNVIY